MLSIKPRSRLVLVVGSLAAVLGLALWASEGWEIAACEDFLKEGLKSSSTYRRGNVTTRDEAVTAARIAELTGRQPRGSEALGLRTVVIEYDAGNAFGTPIRGASRCAPPSRRGGCRSATTDSAIFLAKVQRDGRLLQRQPEPEYPCCL